MDTSKFDHLPEHIREKVIKSRLAFDIADTVSKQILDNFTVCDLHVAATADKAVTISGMTDDEKVKAGIETFLSEMGDIQLLNNGLMVVPVPGPVSLTANDTTVEIASLSALQDVFRKYQEVEQVEYFLNNPEDKGLLLLMNKTHTLAIYLRYSGDSGFTAINPRGDASQLQGFILSNGQKDEYPTTTLIGNKEAFDVMRYFLLTGERYPGVEWQEE